MRKRGILIFAVLLVSLLPFISSANPLVNANPNTGYQIFYPQFQYVKQSSSFELHIHVSNLSNGLPLQNTQAACFLHLYNVSGLHTFEGTIPIDSSSLYDYGLFITTGNFTSLGEHAFLIWCNSTQFGGEAKGTFMVTPTGVELITGKSVLYGLVWVISFLIFLGLLIYGLAAEGNNKRDEMTGYILDVSNVKYLKIFSLAFSYLVLVFLSYFTWMISYSYLDMDFMSSIFQFIFYGLAIATLPLFIVFCYLLIANKVRDSKIQEALSRGLRIK